MHSESRTLIFVYGTLKRGFCRSHHLAGQTFLEAACTIPGYTMYDCGEYPGLVVNPTDGVCIQGELWSVNGPGIAILDEVEGVAENWFSRQQIELQHPAIPETVQAYYFEGDVTRLPVYGDNWCKGF
ncbi:gamma-glutamylcyclotransferase family protein [uncultured Gimesia sp.]|jgi:gamma-glutamylaminecyclotransferase|uniref:gamma-glutamylcyclotransferase family protein n=1 Tax=uncultured Gimesia sp. TaxID=1678688 RepID=UPI002618DB01|nr:gamma-glutamylcyclotransferase family protein [uncultured Gimesia sp.]